MKADIERINIRPKGQNNKWTKYHKGQNDKWTKIQWTK